MLNTGKPILGFQGEYRWLSNFVPVDIEFDDVIYPSVEHAYVAAKCNDICDRSPIQKMTAGQAKRYGKTMHLSPWFESSKISIMRGFLDQKFSKEPYRQLLIDTDGSYIEETNAWGDTFWGVCDGKGQNILGVLIMQIRSEILWENMVDSHTKT